VTIALWTASNVFTSGIAKLATWEGAANYRHMADFCRWDCNWYASVVQSGYWSTPIKESIAVNWPFYPLFPLSAYVLRESFRLSIPTSLVLAGKLELLFAIYAFMLMFSEELESIEDRVRAASLVAFNPYLIYAHAGYAEPLYFALIALSFYFAKRSKWLAAGSMAGLASATRILGVVFCASYLISAFRKDTSRVLLRNLDLNKIIGLLLCPLGTAFFLLYLYHHTGDALAFEHAHVSWGKVPGNPLHTLVWCFVQTHWPRVWGVMILVAWLASAWLFKLRKPEMGTFLALVDLIAASTGYWAVARYIWWQPPFLYAIYRLLRRSSGAWLVYTAFAAGMAAFMVVEWFSGHNFVV